MKLQGWDGYSHSKNTSVKLMLLWLPVSCKYFKNPWETSASLKMRQAVYISHVIKELPTH